MSDEHNHTPGIFCDDCPGALRRNIKRVLALHKWQGAFAQPADGRDCSCGWRMPFRETDQHLGHLAGELAAVLTDLGWERSADTQLAATEAKLAAARLALAACRDVRKAGRE